MSDRPNHRRKRCQRCKGSKRVEVKVVGRPGRPPRTTLIRCPRCLGQPQEP